MYFKYDLYLICCLLETDIPHSLLRGGEFRLYNQKFIYYFLNHKFHREYSLQTTVEALE